MLKCQILVSANNLKEFSSIETLDNVEKITAESQDGQVTILPEHCNYMALIRSCKIVRCSLDDNKNQDQQIITIKLENGVLLVKNNLVFINCDSYTES